MGRRGVIGLMQLMELNGEERKCDTQRRQFKIAKGSRTFSGASCKVKGEQQLRKAEDSRREDGKRAE